MQLLICKYFQKLLFPTKITNPIILHSRDVWTRVHKMFKLADTLQRYSSLWHNSSVCVGKKPVYWEQWHSKGLCTIGDLFEDGVFLSYNKLLERFNLVGEEVGRKLCKMYQARIQHFSSQPT